LMNSIIMLKSPQTCAYASSATIAYSNKNAA
jgi:hypothetical protein